MPQDDSRVPTDLTPPEHKGIDKAYMILKAALAGVPLVGGPANELLGLVFGDPYQKRHQKWCEVVASVLNYLVNKKGIPIEDLQENEVFISAVANASQIALRNHQKEKREALRSALINSVASETLDESLLNQFLNYIDILTVWHIRILRAFRSPQPRKQDERYSPISTSLAEVLEETYPELHGKRSTYDVYWRDLYARGLVNTDNLHGATSQGAYSKRTTELGDQFLDFISHPEAEGEMKAGTT